VRETVTLVVKELFLPDREGVIFLI